MDLIKKYVAFVQINGLYINHNIIFYIICYHEPRKKLKEVGKPSLFLLKKVIASAHSKGSKSSGFNSILQKFYKIICEIIVSKTLCGIFLIFGRSSFINNFMVKSNFLAPRNHQKLNILKPIYF